MVAGSNLANSPEPYVWMSNLSFLSPDSKCHSFDHRANGYARGEGIGVVVLKRLSEAIRDGNTIRAVIRSTGSNEDGKTPGITQPSREAQERLIRETYQKAGLSMAHTRFFEAHGTGTPMGDPREAQAIGMAFQKYRSINDPLYVYVQHFISVVSRADLEQRSSQVQHWTSRRCQWYGRPDKSHHGAGEGRHSSQHQL